MARAAARREDAEAPEPDRLEGFLHPRETVDLFGHGEAEAELRAAIDLGKAHHAWLFSGPAGIGKATLAYRFARYVLASANERRSAPPATLAVPISAGISRRIIAQSEPGLFVIRRASEGKRIFSVIRVDDVRRLKSFLGLTATDSGWRVVIIDTADELNANAANALLKSLEEPPARCIFILISSEPARLLPTIRSRCRVLDLAPLAGTDLTEAITTALEHAGKDDLVPDQAGWSSLEVLTKGSVGQSLALLGGGGLELYQRLLDVMSTLPALDLVKLHGLADDLAGAAQDTRFQMFWSLLEDMIARLVRQAATGSGAAPKEANLVRQLRIAEKLAPWAELWETIVRDKAVTMSLNLDRKSLILGTGLRLRAICG